jgi:hypothetical protein
MAVKYSRHALRRIAERGIPTDWIEAAVTDPDREVRDPKNPDLMRAYKKAIQQPHGHVLRVVYRRVGTDILVITAFPDRTAE